MYHLTSKRGGKFADLLTSLNGARNRSSMRRSSNPCRTPVVFSSARSLGCYAVLQTADWQIVAWWRWVCSLLFSGGGNCAGFVTSPISYAFLLGVGSYDMLISFLCCDVVHGMIGSEGSWFIQTICRIHSHWLSPVNSQFFRTSAALKR
jgi:hypothetical protein